MEGDAGAEGGGGGGLGREAVLEVPEGGRGRVVGGFDQELQLAAGGEDPAGDEEFGVAGLGVEAVTGEIGEFGDDGGAEGFAENLVRGVPGEVFKRGDDGDLREGVGEATDPIGDEGDDGDQGEGESGAPAEAGRGEVGERMDGDQEPVAGLGDGFDVRAAGGGGAEGFAEEGDVLG